MIRRFAVLESNGIHSQILSMRIEKYTICSLGMVDSQIEEKSNDPIELARRKKARYLSERINQYNHLARSTKDVRKWLARVR